MTTKNLDTKSTEIKDVEKVADTSTENRHWTIKIPKPRKPSWLTAKNVGIAALTTIGIMAVASKFSEAPQVDNGVPQIEPQYDYEEDGPSTPLTSEDVDESLDSDNSN